ncbi:MAG: hypothetical protein PHT27_07885 [Candidatus Izemoplasmatales bacterium]|nr:hypothetical protein [Candidatus Izemoplasmatales bacterium]
MLYIVSFEKLFLDCTINYLNPKISLFYIMAIPIVFVHKGDSFYLKYALSNARKFNPDSKIYLLNDGTKEEFEGIIKLDLNKFNKYSKELDKLYVHKTKSNPEIELFCIKRWFLLRAFVEKYKIKKVFALDSDVLLFQNITKDSLNYSKYDFTLSQGSCAHAIFINSKKVLIEYTKLAIDFYKNKVGKVEYEANGTITDMSFWKVLNGSKKFKIGEITEIIQSATYDAGLLIEQKEVLIRKGFKQIIFKDSLPFGKTKTGLIRMKCLHCQGPTKFYMKYYSKGKITHLDEINIKLMMWARDNLSPLLSNNIRTKFKEIIKNLGF